MRKPRSTSSNAAASTRRLGPLRALLPFAAPYKGRIALAFLALLAASAATLIVPLALRRIIDFGFSSEEREMVDWYFATMLAVAAFLALASASRFYLVMTLGERVVADIRNAVFAHLTGLSASFYDQSRAGELVSRLTADTTLIKATFGSSASLALRNLFLFAGASIMMVVTSPRLSALVLVAIPFIVLPLVAFGRSVRQKSRKAQDTLADASAMAAESLGAMRTVQAFNAEPALKAGFSHAVERAYDGARSATATRALLTAVVIFLVFGSVVAVLWWGATDVLFGRMSAGLLGQFVLYAVFAAGALGEISQVWSDISQAAGAAERLDELLHVPSAVVEVPSPRVLPKPPRGQIRFEHIDFAYPARPDLPVLKDLSIEIAAGETIAVVGPSGAGKSTLIHLLLRFYDPQSGFVTIDGVDIAQASLSDLRSRIALVPQDSVIFAGTARDNIRFGKPDASDAQIEAAALSAAADGFIRALPEGYETSIGERGVTLSGGQKQRIAIARAILRNAPILLLDEATSALDAESESLVQNALADLMKGRTTLVVAHRLATVLRADRILVMDEGRVVEIGTHAELIARGGLYARLASLQFSDPSTALR
ncbi:ABC transporter transmembrane domain-containing protein [Terrihabitans rhizophilus]|uniref:ABC transporter transmembrane domain-containing protein n=1 Tax=Terrihabitans rhizophilus TaxID=3092662 RepID=A0ABU4RRH8_9HYPH|nr:ABC transporter transmembrane domain-containing protein [Terrihabitans sp. PJ23]MDX6806694.1 ABC transporter transmembrane domain-containing protein [Terrihabitans sp. PJ23]